MSRSPKRLKKRMKEIWYRVTKYCRTVDRCLKVDTARIKDPRSVRNTRPTPNHVRVGQCCTLYLASGTEYVGVYSTWAHGPLCAPVRTKPSRSGKEDGVSLGVIQSPQDSILVPRLLSSSASWLEARGSRLEARWNFVGRCFLGKISDS